MAHQLCISINHSAFTSLTWSFSIGCGGNKVRHVEKFVVEDTKFESQDNYSLTALDLIETTAQIVNDTLLSNRKGVYRECAIFNQYRNYDCIIII